MKKFTGSIILLFLCAAAHAQQDPLYAQYLNNPFLINPAYAGSINMLTASVQYRTQWAQFAGNPVTVAATAHMPMIEKKMGLGFQLIEDRIGESRNTEFNAAYSYKLNLKNSVLSFGLQAGLIQFSNNPDDLNIFDPDDPNFFPYSEIKFNTGVGLLITSDKYLMSISVPRLLPATVSQGGDPIEVYNRNVYLMGAYLMPLTEKIRFKPSVLLRYAANNPISADVNASLVMLDTYSAGLFTRNFNTYGVLMNMRFKKFYFGYVFELPTNQSVGTNFTTHEVMIGFRFKALNFHDPLTINNF
ncbi:MAG: type IX secretion system membrane protein PorP/SprF [Cyclobacteriaceae bacterium]|nr:type IX secretion system membrane protein PorP/SprF [Cyclobacteriaceae bacterium]